VASEPVEPYFTRVLRGLSFCLGVSKIFLGENAIVNGVVKRRIKCNTKRMIDNIGIIMV
jgi:hypothetical protein